MNLMFSKTEITSDPKESTVHSRKTVSRSPAKVLFRQKSFWRKNKTWSNIRSQRASKQQCSRKRYSSSIHSGFNAKRLMT